MVTVGADATVELPARSRVARRRRRLLGLVWAVAFGLIAGPGAMAGSDPDDRPPAQAPAAEAAQTEEDQVVCRRIRVTGSHIRQRICHKKSEWRAMQERAREFLNQKERSTRDSEG